MEARLDTPRKFYFLPSAYNLGLDGLLTLRVYKNDYSAQISGSPFNAVLLVLPAESATAGVYETAEVTFPSVGTYHLLWKCTSPAITVSQTVTVMDDPVGDFPTEFNQRARYETPSYVTASDVVLRIIDEDGVRVGAVLTTAATAVTGVYLTTTTFSLSAAGVYLFLWTSTIGGYTYTRIEQRLVLTSASQRTVTIFVMDTTITPSTPVDATDVLISTTAGSPLQQARTGTAGKVQFQLDDGDYIVTLRKTGYVFTRNNEPITASSTGDNTTYIISEPFAPTFDPAPAFAVGSKSTMTLDLVDASGEPALGVRVFVTPQLNLNTATDLDGAIVGLNSAMHTATTDGNGHAEIVLIRGQTVTAFIEASSFRRTFVVPASTSFNLLTVTSIQNDPLAVVVDTTTAAERRS